MDTEKKQEFLLRAPERDDLPAVVDLLNASRLDTLGTPSFSVEHMRTQWEQPDTDLNRDKRLAIADEAIVGYCSIHSAAPYVKNFLTACTHPSQRGRGIGTALNQWGEARVLENLPLAPPGARVTLNCTTINTHAAGAQLLDELGFQHIRSFYEMKIEMASPPPPPVWPASITVRGMVANREEEAVFRAANEINRDHWGHVEEPFEEEFPKWLRWIRNVPDYDPDFFFVAWDGDEIAGIALCFPKDNDFPDLCWLETLGVRRPWRRRGLGSALLHHVFGASYRRDIQKVGLGVDAQSLTGATRLYEKAGMHVFRQWDTYEKELHPGEDLTTTQLEN